jgi:hypothetical protein
VLQVMSQMAASPAQQDETIIFKVWYFQKQQLCLIVQLKAWHTGCTSPPPPPPSTPRHSPQEEGSTFWGGCTSTQADGLTNDVVSPALVWTHELCFQYVYIPADR